MATEISRLSKSCAERVKFSKLNTNMYNHNLGPCLDAFVSVFFLVRWLYVSHFK